MINNENKDRLFAFIFGRWENREWTLSMYNSVNNTDYGDASEIEINTIDDSVYMGMKNDVSFLLRYRVNLWAHQSTPNPNMPVRELMYLGRLYDKYIHQQKANIYGSKLIKLPLPKIVVFYNGTRSEPDEVILRLSDAFPDGIDKSESDVEVRVRMLNINKGHNQQLMDACKPLYEYSWFIDKIRNNLENLTIEEATDKAIDDMPEDFLIREFLIGNRAEVKNMCLTEYNEEETMQMFKQEGVEEGELRRAKEVYDRCIARGMSEADAMEISGLEEAQKKVADALNDTEDAA